MRLLAVESCGAFAAALGPEGCRASLLPVVQKFAADKSWRVRYNVAQQLVALCEALGPDTTRCAVWGAGEAACSLSRGCSPPSTTGECWRLTA